MQLTEGSLVKIKGDYVEPRESHISFLYKSHTIILHGGLIDENAVPQELLAINTLEQTSSTISEVSGKSPGMLESHSCAQLGEQFVIYGGNSRFELTSKLFQESPTK